MTTAISIRGMGSYIPRLVHDNDSLPPLDKPVSAEALAHIGVQRRGWASEAETPAMMGAAAAREALARAGISELESIDLIIVANWTQRRYIPEWAPALQQQLGARRAFAFDISGACTGFVNGCGIARQFLRDARYRRALVVAAETTAARARPGSKGTLILGDAAGAFVLEAGEAAGGRLLDCEMRSYGEHHGIMDTTPEGGWVRTHIPQRELNQLAARTMAEVCASVLERNGLGLDDIDWLVPHSGTRGVQAKVQATLGMDPDKILTNYAEVGNVSSASIPVALDHFMREGRVQPGDLVLSPAVGTGWYGAAMLLRV